jgi:hypothetical protein
MEDSASVPCIYFITLSTPNADLKRQYTKLLGLSMPPTPLWLSYTLEQPVSVSIDNTSVFVPGGGTGVPPAGFRRTELIAQKNGGHNALVAEMEVNTTVFYFSVKRDERRRLNLTHEYQVVFVEPGDGSHVFGVQLGDSCFVLHTPYHADKA